MDAILPTIVALTFAALPVPLAVLCVLAIRRRRRVLERNFVAGTRALGIEVQGALGAWTCRLEHQDSQFIAETWAYQVPGSEGGTSSKVGTRVRMLHRLGRDNVVLRSKGTLIDPPPLTVQVGTSPHWHAFEAFATSPAAISTWLSSSAQPIAAGVPGLVSLELSNGFASLIHDGELHDAAVLLPLADALAAFAAGRPLQPRPPVSVATPRSVTWLYIATFLSLTCSPVATIFATWPGIPSFFWPLFCEPDAKLKTYWESGSEPGTANYIMKCVDHGARTSTSNLGSVTYHLMAFGLIVSLILVVFLIFWSRAMRGVPRDPTPRLDRGARGPYRDARPG